MSPEGPSAAGPAPTVGTTAEPTAGPEPLGYAEALAELDEILAELEDPDLDVDQLGGQVRRAAQLVAFCKQRIAGARIEVATVTSDDDPL